MEVKSHLNIPFYKSPRLVHSNGTACFRSQRLLKRGPRTTISILIRWMTQPLWSHLIHWNTVFCFDLSKSVTTINWDPNRKGIIVCQFWIWTTFSSQTCHCKHSTSAWTKRADCCLHFSPFHVDWSKEISTRHATGEEGDNRQRSGFAKFVNIYRISLTVEILWNFVHWFCWCWWSHEEDIYLRQRRIRNKSRICRLKTIVQSCLSTTLTLSKSDSKLHCPFKGWSTSIRGPTTPQLQGLWRTRIQKTIRSSMVLEYKR
jgi:hypothetical protein